MEGRGQEAPRRRLSTHPWRSTVPVTLDIA